MAIEQLLAQLELEAGVEAEGIVERARVRAREMTAKAAADLDARGAEAVAPEERRLRAEVGRRLAGARRDARREILLARRGLLDRVLHEARRCLPAELRKGRYRKALPVHLAEALVYLDGRGVTVRCPPALAEPVRAVLGDRPDTRVTADESIGSGIVVEAADGSVTIDNTLEARLDRIADALALDVITRAEVT